jgi:pimeloyl-ACP methyl ester carboxylesterase
MNPPVRWVTTSDGRTLGVCEWGDPAGQTVFQLHGTPGSRLSRHPDENVYRGAGARLITYDRPGYGLSARHAGRDVASAAADVAAIANALGVQSFAVVGTSGGGPHALACAALLADRVSRCACLVSIAPFDAPGLDYFAGTTQGNIDEFTWALGGEDELRPHLEQRAPEMLEHIEADSDRPLGEAYEVSEADRQIFARDDIRRVLIETAREALRQGVDGWVDDDIAFVRPWGFEITDVRVPTTVCYGADDTLVPAAHGKWLAEHLPQARVDLLEGGHFATFDKMRDIVTWLTLT